MESVRALTEYCEILEHLDNKCLSPTAKYVVAVDGSRKFDCGFAMIGNLHSSDAICFHADFLVLGAHGKGGPAIDQVHHVPWEVLRGITSIPTLIVPPAPVNSVISKQYVFVVAVDTSIAATRCLNATLKLMRPIDVLRVVHFYEKPIVGEYDSTPFDWYHSVVEAAQVGQSFTAQQ
ncbi:unnamed protein product [Phytophthora lilii]|uniref:Unnamed protein product n=1 Tax=Phytophthora lilii TaxID=2077276 RepID=A0A9W6X2W3_9STRA|nr:unnamed protein product [Phytophthora lilii]